jgi:hypothetical protein
MLAKESHQETETETDGKTASKGRRKKGERRTTSYVMQRESAYDLGLDRGHFLHHGHVLLLLRRHHAAARRVRTASQS